MNPYLSPVSGTNTDLNTLAYDGIAGNVLVSTSAGTIGGSRDTASFGWDTTNFGPDGWEDLNCSAEHD